VSSPWSQETKKQDCILKSQAFNPIVRLLLRVVLVVLVVTTVQCIVKVKRHLVQWYTNTTFVLETDYDLKFGNKRISGTVRLRVLPDFGETSSIGPTPSVPRTSNAPLPFPEEATASTLQNHPSEGWPLQVEHRRYSDYFDQTGAPRQWTNLERLVAEAPFRRSVEIDEISVPSWLADLRETGDSVFGSGRY